MVRIRVKVELLLVDSLTECYNENCVDMYRDSLGYGYEYST